MLARFAVAVIGCVMMCVSVAKAQEVDRIAAVVNDEIISIHDLEGRVKLALVMSGFPDNLENRRRAVPQVLRKMIDERLQLQEANRVKISVSAEDIGRSIRGVELQNKMPTGGLLSMLSKAGVDTDAARDQIRADLAWIKLTTRVLQPNVKVGEDEINDRLDGLKQNLGRSEYLLAEIFLSVDSPAQEEEARRMGERLLDQLKAGAPFQALARQFSQTGSAGNGGMLGWVVDINLDDEIKAAVVPLGKGDVSPLIRISNGYNILAVVDKRVSGQGQAEDEIVSVAQIFFPNPAGGAVPREQLAAKAAELTAPLKTCGDFEEFGRKLNSAKSNRVNNTRKSDLPAVVQGGITNLPVNKVSAPTDGSDGLMVFMVCSRSGLGGEAGLPSREAIRRQIEDERMDLQGKRYLRDLRRAAFVDFRL